MSISAERLKHYEEEMHRFETEIASASSSFDQNVAVSSTSTVASTTLPQRTSSTFSQPPVFVPSHLQAPPPPANVFSLVHLQNHNVYTAQATPYAPPLPLPPPHVMHAISTTGTSSAARSVYSAAPQINKFTMSMEYEAADSSVTNNQIAKAGTSLAEAQKAAANLVLQRDIETVQALQKQKNLKATIESNNKRKFVRVAAGRSWVDNSLAEWDPNDFRIFCGDLGNEVSDEVLTRVFNRYSSFQRAKIIRDKRTGKSKGYGFVSFKDPADFTRAMREMNGKYVGNRPIKLKRSDWKTRQLEEVKKKEKEKRRFGQKL